MRNALTAPVAEALVSPGPVKWCKRCSRRHPSRQGCNLARVVVEARTGRMVERLIHPSARSDA